MIRRPPRSTQSRSSAASDVYKRQAPSCGKPREKAHQETAAALAVISSIQGGVQVRIAGSDAWLAGSTGTAIYEGDSIQTVSYTHLRAHETRHDLVCRLLL